MPVQYDLGTLPEFPGQSKTYDLTANGQIPPNAKAVLVYGICYNARRRQLSERLLRHFHTSGGNKILAVYERGYRTRLDGR